VAERFGGLDVLVNNAGVISMEPIVETTDEEYERMMNANVRSVYLASREAAKRMTAGGRIINIGSINADRAFGPGMTLYVTSKAAVAGFTRALAAELSEQGVTVDCIQPGPVDTDMNPADGEFADFVRGFTALGRYARPEEIAGLAAFLAGLQGGHLTGTTRRGRYLRRRKSLRHRLTSASARRPRP
jgi:3-oxoacyl-[acyl-carrier protein] reductase